MFRNALRLGICLVVVMLIGPQLADAQGRGGNPKPQLIVTKTTVVGIPFTCFSLGNGRPALLGIEVSGQNFGDAPDAFLGNDRGGLDQLTLCPGFGPGQSTALFLLFAEECPPEGPCRIPTPPGPGNYLLVVTRGPSATDVYNFNVTVQGLGSGVF